MLRLVAAALVTMSIVAWPLEADAAPRRSSSADVTVSVSDSPDPVRVGETITYEVSVVNMGPASASDVTVTDELPTTLNFVAATSSKGTCSGGQRVSCSLGTLAKGETAALTVKADAAQAGTVTNTVTVTSQSDTTPGNNSAAAVTTVEEPESVTVDLLVEIGVPYRSCSVRVPEGASEWSVLDAAVASGCLRSWSRPDDDGWSQLCIDDVCDGIPVGYAPPASYCCHTIWLTSVTGGSPSGTAAQDALFNFQYSDGLYPLCLTCP